MGGFIINASVSVRKWRCPCHLILLYLPITRRLQYSYIFEMADVEEPKNLVSFTGFTEDTYKTLNDLSSQEHAKLSRPAIEIVENIRQGGPGPLPAKGKEFSDIVTFLENLVSNDDSNNLEIFPPLDEIQSASLTAHSLAAYISVLEPSILKRVVPRIVSDVTLWVSRLFRFFESSATFHEDPREALTRICRLLLRSRYPKFAQEGYETLFPRPPVIYVSAATRTGMGQYLCMQMGLPRSCVSVVPCNSVAGSQFAMDVAVLERMVQEDCAAQKVPLVLIAHAGVPSVGQVDNLQRLQEICKSHDVWLHVEGHSLAGLCLVPAPNLPAKIGDSVTLPLGIWLGLPALPYVTLHRATDAALTLAAGLGTPPLHNRLICLPVWIALQQLGQEGAVSRIRHAFELSRFVLDMISSVPQLRIVGKEQLGDDHLKLPNMSEITSKAVSTMVLFDVLAPTIAFRYELASTEHQNEFNGQPLPSLSYVNSLNSWLCQILQRDSLRVPVDIIEVDRIGVCIRYSPLENAQAIGTTVDDVHKFLESLSQQLDILNATVRHKQTFTALVSQDPNLQLVPIANWAGLGGVRYIPEILKDNQLGDLPDSGKEEVNRINHELVSQLKATDSAFSLGEGEDGLLCVRFGMVIEDTDVEDLLALVTQTGKDIEESSKYLETMAEAVRKGIETAHEDLKKENEERIWQEGLLRHVPLVGSVVNWWSPLPKETGIKGRSFTLTSGVVESTENIYKYHMQINQDASLGSIAMTPKPTVQTAVQAGEHSRSSSSSSLTNQSEPKNTSVITAS